MTHESDPFFVTLKSVYVGIRILLCERRENFIHFALDPACMVLNKTRRRDILAFLAADFNVQRRYKQCVFHLGWSPTPCVGEFEVRMSSQGNFNVSAIVIIALQSIRLGHPPVFRADQTDTPRRKIIYSQFPWQLDRHL